jgi:hypothetical protein
MNWAAVLGVVSLITAVGGLVGPPTRLWLGVLGAGHGDLGPTVVEAMLAYHAVRTASVLRGLGAAAYLDGTGDYLEAPLWRAERLIAQGRAHLAADLGVQGGPLPAAVLATTPAFAHTAPALLDDVARAVARTTLMLQESPRASLRRWPGRLDRGARASLAAALARARYDHLWPTDPRPDRALFVRLDVLRRAVGLPAASPPPILEGPAEAAMRGLPPADGGSLSR